MELFIQNEFISISQLAMNMYRQKFVQFLPIQLSYSIKNMLVKGSMYEFNLTLYKIWVTVFFRQLKICSYDGLSVTDGDYITVR